jgi:plasmid stabilization system protein ParE
LQRSRFEKQKNGGARDRPAAPNAVRLELQRAFTLIAAQPRIGSRATNAMLEGVRRIFTT